MEKYVRRADYDDMPLELKLGILKYELSIAEEEEKAHAQLAVTTMETEIEKRRIRPATELSRSEMLDRVGTAGRPWS